MSLRAEQRVAAYLDTLPPVDSAWPPDVRAVFQEVHDRLFEEGLTAQDVVSRCGVADHNVYSRFRHYVGRGIKEYILEHRLALAKRLLRDDALPVGQVAFTVGYASPGGFTMTFRRREGCTPREFRDRQEE